MRCLKLNASLNSAIVGICLVALSGCASTPLSERSAKDIAIKALGSQMLKTSYEVESVSSFSLQQREASELSAAALIEGIDDRIEVEDYRPDQNILSLKNQEQIAQVATLSADTAFDTLRSAQQKLSTERAFEIKERIYERVYAAIQGEQSTFEIVDLAALTAQDVVIEQMQPKASGYFDLSEAEQDLLHANLGADLDDVIELSYQVDERIYLQLSQVLKPSENPSLQSNPTSKILKKLLGDSVFINELNQHSLSPFYIKQHFAYLPRQSKLSGIQFVGFDNDYTQAQIKIPFEANWQELSVTMDPGALLPIAPLFVSQDNNFLANYQPGDSLRLQVPEHWIDQDTRDLVIDALIKSLDSTLGSLRDDLFTSVSLSEEARKMGAAKAILMEIESEDQVKFIVTLIRDLAKNMRLNADADNLSDDRKLKYSSLADQMLKMVDAVYVTYEQDKELKQAIANQLGKLDMTLYVDSRGRMTGAKVDQFSEMTAQDGTILGIRIESIIDVKNFGRAKAPYAPKPSQIIDGNAILTQFLEERQAQKTLESADGADLSKALSRLPSSKSATPQASLGAEVGAQQSSAALEAPTIGDGVATDPNAEQLSLWMETNKILIESDPESKAEFCEIYAQFDSQSADQKSAALEIFSQNTLSSDAAGAAAAGSVFFRYLAKSYSDKNLDCSTLAP